MKGIEVLLIGAMVALVAVTVPFVSQAVYADDIGYIERLVPAESQEVETGGGEVPLEFLTPVDRSNDTGRIEALAPAESGEAETGGGETSPMDWVPIAPVERGHDTDRIELLLPAK